MGFPIYPRQEHILVEVYLERNVLFRILELPTIILAILLIFLAIF